MRSSDKDELYWKRWILKNFENKNHIVENEMKVFIMEIEKKS